MDATIGTMGMDIGHGHLPSQTTHVIYNTLTGWGEQQQKQQQEEQSNESQ